MALSNVQLLTYLQLPKIGNKKVFALGNYAQSNAISLESNLDLLDYINSCIETKVITGIKEKFDICDLEDANNIAKSIISKSFDLQISVVSFYDEPFPLNLKSIVDDKGNNNSPLFLFVKGNIENLSLPGIAIIGTREPTKEGLFAGNYFSKYFASQGFNIISGLAIGCDTSAHKGALEANGITTAFLANGLDMPIYPKENIQLAEDILAKGGLLISEYPIGTPLMANRLVERDRLQSGLANATLAIQTGIKGGTMHAVNATINNGKPLFMVQYKGEVLKHEKVQGNISLINQGLAKPLTSDNLAEALSLIKLSKESNDILTANNSPIQTSLFPDLL